MPPFFAQTQTQGITQPGNIGLLGASGGHALIGTALCPGKPGGGMFPKKKIDFTGSRSTNHFRKSPRIIS
jgi:hypothetical protein